MSLSPQTPTFKDIQKHYDHLFKTEGIRDETRGYAWHTKTLLNEKMAPGRILDIACGGGYFLEQLRNASAGTADLFGIDISPKAIELAQSSCPEAHYLLCVAKYLPFPAASFDAITCLGSLEHFLDLSGAIKEMRRVATDDAVFYILVPNLYWYKDLISVFLTGNKVDRNQTQERFYCLGEWEKLLTENGLEIKKTLKYNGIARRPFKQWLKDLLIPLKFSYHFVFICRKAKRG
jgi:SAM-dependent methyltransferase